MAPLRVGSPQRNKHPRDWEHQHHPQQISLTGPMTHPQHHHPFGAGPSRGAYHYFFGCSSGSILKMWRCSRTSPFLFLRHLCASVLTGLYFPTTQHFGHASLLRCIFPAFFALHYLLLRSGVHLAVRWGVSSGFATELVG